MKTLKRYLSFVLPVVATVALLFASCSGIKDKEAKVPQSAAFVATTNLGSLWQKGELSNIDNIQSYSILREGLAEAMPQVEALLTNFMKDPSTSGIDVDKDILAFADVNGENLMASTVTLSASLKSKDDFTKFLNSIADITGEKLTIEDGDLSYLSLDPNVLMAYNNKSVVLVAGGNGSTLKDYAKSLFELKESESLLANDHYKAYWDNRKDMGLFLSFASWFGEKGFMNSPMLKPYMTEVSEAQIAMLKEAAYYTTTSFEDGSIVITSKNLGTPTNDPKFLGDGIDNTLMAFMPEPTLAAFSFSLNMPACLEFIASDKATAEVFNEPIKELGCTIKDIVEIFAGDFVASFYGMSKNNMPLCAVACDIAKADFVNNFIAQAGLKGNNNFYDLGDGMTLFFDGKNLAFTTDANAPKVYAQGGYQNSLAIVADKARKGNYVYLDLKIQDYPQELLNLIGYTVDANPILDQVLSLFDYAEVVTVAPDEARGIIKLTDNRNALASIVSLIDNAAIALLAAEPCDETTEEVIALED